MSKVIDEVVAELQYQEGKWGVESDDTKNTPWMWASYIAQYATKWMRGSFLPLEREVTDVFREAMIKVAALAIAAVQSVDRQRQLNTKTFYEVDEA